MPMTQDLSQHINAVIDIARSAGQLILDIYEKKSIRRLPKVMKHPLLAQILPRINLLSSSYQS